MNENRYILSDDIQNLFFDKAKQKKKISIQQTHEKKTAYFDHKHQKSMIQENENDDDDCESGAFDFPDIFHEISIGHFLVCVCVCVSAVFRVNFFFCNQIKQYWP